MTLIYKRLFLLAAAGLTATLIALNFQVDQPEIQTEVSASDWETAIKSQILLSEYHFRKAGVMEFAAVNRRNNSRFIIHPGGFIAKNRLDNSESLDVKIIKVQAGITSLSMPTLDWNAESGQILTATSNDFSIEYVNSPEGFRQNFIIEDAEPLCENVQVQIEINGSDELIINENGDLECIKDDHVFMEYGELLAYDAYGKILESKMSVEGNIITLSANTTEAHFPVTIDPLSSTPNWTYEGNQIGANMAFAVSTAGDVNNDGYDDVVVGAAAYDAGDIDEGKAFLFLGGPAGLSTTPVWEDEGDNASGLMGKSVAAAGDVNGDGYGDLLIGLGLYSGGETEEGRAHLYYGNATGVSTEPDWFYEPNQAGVGLGFPLEGLGDVNGDGYDDVIIGGNGYDGDLVDEGRAFVFYGSADGLADEPDWYVEGNNANAALGHAVSAAGDVNNDGYNDVIIGAWNYSGALANNGKAWVFLGGPTGLSNTANWELEGDQSNGYYAFWVSGVGDVNNDNYDDIMVGAKRYDVEFEDEGKAWLYLGGPTGPSTTTVWTGEGDNDGAEYAIQFGPAGDVNADGFDDVVMGSHFHSASFTKEGITYLYLGKATGLETTPAWSFLGGVGQANMGWTCDGAGDVNNDGFADIITGAFKYTNPETYEGSAFVFHGLNTCPTPSGYVLDALSATTADVSWTGGASADIYKILVKGSGETYLFLSGSEYYSIPGLTPSKKYKSWVQARCGATWTMRSNVLIFITPPLRTSGETGMSTYPNPANDWLYVQSGTNREGNYNIQIFDIQGNAVMELETGFIEPNARVALDVRPLSKGFYTFLVSGNGQTKQGNFIKQ